jgi:thiol-disulfide isomerase/thioredoxin
MKKIPAFAIAVAAVLIAIAAAVFVLFPADSGGGNSGLSSEAPQNILQTEEFPILGQSHIGQGEPVDYNSNPPTSGGHYGSVRPWGVFDQEVADQGALHNLEHGGIWITYRPDLEQSSLRQLREITARYPNAVLMSPRPENDSPIAIVSWGRVMRLESVDAENIDLYIRTYVNNSPEQFASLDTPVAQEVVELEDGQPFPQFSLSDVDGIEATLATLSGRPSIIWFTTGWCVPCQIGAEVVAELDAELGGGAFNVLVVFVDPRENNDDLRRWRADFAAADWQVAFDDLSNPLAARIGLQYLDSKYLLDANGVLLNQDFRIADDAYLEIIRRAVEES